jgi:hypothetical protein
LVAQATERAAHSNDLATALAAILTQGRLAS